MTALDLSSATRVLTPPASAFTSIAYGDATLNADTGSQAVGDWDGSPTIVGDDTYLAATAPFSIPQDTAIFIATAGLPTGMGNWEILWHYSGFDIGVNDEYLSYAYYGNSVSMGSSVELPTPITPTDVVIWCIVSNSTEGRVLNNLDGTLAFTASPQAASPSDNFEVYPHASAHILGVWQFDGVTVSETDAIDTMAAIIAALAGGAPTGVFASGSSGWGISASPATVTVGVDTSLPPLPDVTSAGAVEPPEPPEPADPEVLYASGIAPIRHAWEDMPAPTLDGNGNPVAWAYDADGGEPIGTLQYVFEGVDTTVIRGIPTPEPTYGRGEPFGAKAATFEFPQYTAFHSRPSWARAGANVSIRMRMLADNSKVSLWEGVVVADGEQSTGGLRVECHGVLMAADLQRRPPTNQTAPKDIGKLLAEVLNKVASRRYNHTTEVVTGIRSSVSGGYEPVLTGFAQRILATAAKNGKRWTISCAVRTPVIETKDFSTIAWDIRYGQRGIKVDLTRDATGAPNAIYGWGVNPDGGRWFNRMFPGWRGDETPPYPFDPPDQSILIGMRDSDTDSGTGVSMVQDKLGRPVTGTFSYDDSVATRAAQREGGILEDGIPGPQTWAMLFQPGANGGTLAGSFVLPLAYSPKVMPRLYGPDGDDVGKNPAFDPSILRVDDVVDYGQGVEKSRAKADARERLSKQGKPGWAGTITFTTDPESKHRRFLKEGENGRIRGFNGSNLVVHVAQVTHSATSTQLLVDEHGRDYPELQALLERDRNATDPAKVARRRLLQGEVPSNRPEYDAESPGGRIVKHAVYGGLWTLARVPIGDFGTVARTVLRTTSSPREFAFAVFGRHVTANEIAAKVGNPLTATSNPWDDDTLDTELGLLQAFGWTEQPCGYFPKAKTNPSGGSGAPITGRHEDTLAWDYACANGQDLYVATFASGNCFIEGRLYGRAG